MVKKTKVKYQVLFVPHYGKVKEWGRMRITARRNHKSKFTLKQIMKIVKFLRKRGDKAIEIVRV